MANPNLYTEPLHVNAGGYYLWSAHLAVKLDELDWAHQLPVQHPTFPSDLTIADPPPATGPNGCYTEEDLSGYPGTVPVNERCTTQPTPIDIWILYCLYTGNCKI